MLKGKTVLITGSSSGIGAETARRAKQYGAEVILHGRTESDHLKALAADLKSGYIFCDVGDKNAVKEAVKNLLAKHKKIDCLVNCAGTAVPESFLETGDEEWIKMFQVNLMGCVHFSQELIPQMLKNNYGRIVNISSLRGMSELSSENRMAYSASKAAVINLSATLAKAYGPDILVNAVSPGFVMTDMSQMWSESSKQRSVANLLKRVLVPADIAEPILYLISDKNSAITGQNLLVDGGFGMTGK